MEIARTHMCTLVLHPVAVVVEQITTPEQRQHAQKQPAVNHCLKHYYDILSWRISLEGKLLKACWFDWRFDRTGPLLPPPSCMSRWLPCPDQRVKAAKTETFLFNGILVVVGQCGNAGICHRNAWQEVGIRAPHSKAAIISFMITCPLKFFTF